MKWNPKDKLYVNPYGWNSKPSRSDEVEYIRKDALLEWLDVNAHIVGHYERQKAFNEVIDKLNTM